jgi:hypothetical protein
LAFVSQKLKGLEPFAGKAKTPAIAAFLGGFGLLGLCPN